MEEKKKSDFFTVMLTLILAPIFWLAAKANADGIKDGQRYKRENKKAD